MGVEDQRREDCACREGKAWWDRDQVWGSERGEEEGEGENSDEGGVGKGDGCEGAIFKEYFFTMDEKHLPPGLRLNYEIDLVHYTSR